MAGTWLAGAQSQRDGEEMEEFPKATFDIQGKLDASYQKNKEERRTTRCDTGAAGCPFGGTPGASRGSFTPEAALPVRTLVEGQDFAVFQRHGATAREASLKEMLETLASSAGMRAILMGEVHDDAVTHLLQLAVLKHLRRHGQRRLILSMEMFEMDVQEVLDEYVLHKAIREEDLLMDSRPWGNYLEDYRPLVQFCRDEGIRVIAANAPRRYVSMVSRKGEQFLRGLEANGCRSLLPPFPLPLPSPAYRRKFEETMSMPTLQSDTGGSCPFIGFSSEDLRSVRPETMQAQLLWDHAMAKSVAEALRADPEAPECVVLHLCGAFHCAHGLGIPEALPRYCPQLHPEAEVLHMGPKRCPEGVTNIICWPGSVGATLKAVRGGSVPKPLETMGDWGREVTLRLTLQLPAEIKMCRPDPEDLMSKIYEGPEVCGKDKVEEASLGLGGLVNVATSPCATEAAPRRNRQRLQARLERAKDLQQREEQAETAPHAAVEHCSGSGGGWCSATVRSFKQRAGKEFQGCSQQAAWEPKRRPREHRNRSTSTGSEAGLVGRQPKHVGSVAAAEPGPWMAEKDRILADELGARTEEIPTEVPEAASPRHVRRRGSADISAVSWMLEYEHVKASGSPAGRGAARELGSPLPAMPAKQLGTEERGRGDLWDSVRLMRLVGCSQRWQIGCLLGCGGLLTLLQYSAYLRATEARWPMVSLAPGDVAFYLQLYGVSSRARWSIANLRDILPDAPLYLLSDGGPSLEQEARAFNASAFQSEQNMNVAGGRNANFTCYKWLKRLEDAAKWAQGYGAKYLMYWEEDLRLLKAPQEFPDVDMVTMGNVANMHAGPFSVESMARLLRKPSKELQPGDLRRQRQAARYQVRYGYSAGPGTSFKISSLLRALEEAPKEELDALYNNESDLCNEDFALSQDWKVRRSSEIQQIIWRFENFDAENRLDRSRNLQCLACLDSCKSQCHCAPDFTLAENLEYFLKRLIYPIFEIKSLEDRTAILWNRPCGQCSQPSCWKDCRRSCHPLCPAVIHPHKTTTLDCE
ncbi:Protein RETICULATA-RELATED 5 [Durusdinium trenchii]|uniref:Chloroplastic n=1 Tax=Durusdinium trenchii TaxID=1381693 RepID=A0ABP0QGM0_9DINO